MIPLLRPKAVRPGDTVAVAALSSGLEAEEADSAAAGIAELQALGFDVQVSPLVELGRHRWWGAAQPAEVAAEFNRLLADPQVRAVFALTGGRWAFSYLDLIDLDAVRADPKPIVGFSDIDAVLLAVHSPTGLVTFHADLVTHGFGYWNELDDGPRSRVAATLLRLLGDSEPAGPLEPIGTWQTWRAGRAEGPVLGGMLNRLIRLQATSFALEPERFDGALLFWEEVGTSTSHIWNDLHVLRQAGILDRITGMIVGPTDLVEVTEDGGDLRETVLDVLGDRDIPVLANVDIGHNPPNIPLPLGVRAGLDAEARTIELLEAAVAVSST
jgi:muramoyltetrapeptide carboxypeptidase